MLIGETESIQKETEMLIKKALDLILDEEDDEQVEEGSLEELHKGVKIIDFELDKKYLYDDLVDTKPVVIPDDDTSDVDATNNFDNTADNIDVFDVYVQMFEQHEQQKEQVENKEERAEDKSTIEQPVNARSTITQTKPIIVNADINVIVAIDDNQMDKTDEKKAEEAPAKEQNVEDQSPPDKVITKEEKTEKEKIDKKEEEENKKEEKKDTLSPSLKKKIIIDDDDNDDDDDSMSIKVPIDMDSLSSSQLMEIAQAMQSRAHKKTLKEQRKEAETLRTKVEILSSLLLKTDIENLVTPMDKLGQLVVDVDDQLKTFE
ncbi:DEK domain-containing chromatin-associated protein 4-like [Cryptomeria japonica]|uniref:DEK domain-containing chromatin-associated protein 4-like n=1 Tax=Cryptomeria japonica TaxID=3369 RepID=UPI0027D9D817|nr:DEK domain-containing chromatin-associated protein 4-like [Cryptomeria japonica]